MHLKACLQFPIFPHILREHTSAFPGAQLLAENIPSKYMKQLQHHLQQQQRKEPPLASQTKQQRSPVTLQGHVAKGRPS